MQRLREIEQRRRELHDELQLLDLEEQQIRKAMASTAAIDPAYIALVQQSNTQHGCAEAQSRFDAATREERSAMFTAAMSEVRALATQTYGALFLQKLLEAGSQEHLLQFLDTLRVGSTLVDVAITTPGSRIIQRFMELLRGTEGLTQLVEMISARIVPLSNDVNACHVVQRVLTNRVAGEKMPLVQALINNIVAVATNKQGCCILQRAMDWLPDPMRGRVVDAVLHYELDLVQDAFGNYVVQHLLDRKDDALIKRTIQPLLHNIAGLACNKFGSNVIEKCVRVAHPNIKQLLMDELTDPSVLPRLLQDSYANYVIQTAISSSSEEQFQQLHAAIRPSFASLKNSPYGVRIEAKIQRRLKDNARARQRQTKKKHEADMRANHQIRPLPMGVPGTLAVSTASPAEFALSASPVAPPSPLARMPYNAVPRQP